MCPHICTCINVIRGPWNGTEVAHPRRPWEQICTQIFLRTCCSRARARVVFAHTARDHITINRIIRTYGIWLCIIIIVVVVVVRRNNLPLRCAFIFRGRRGIRIPVRTSVCIPRAQVTPTVGGCNTASICAKSFRDFRERNERDGVAMRNRYFMYNTVCT
jgi:hypothetical protein